MLLAGCGDTGPPLPPGGIVVEEGDGRERVVSDTAFTPAEMRREQITALEDTGWQEQPDGSYCKDGTRVRVGPPQRERGQPALTRTISDDC